jgi:hypothetical protein
MAQVAAGTRIHGGDQLKLRRKIRLPRRARNRDPAGFERFAQDFQHAPLELGKFVEEQDAVMGKRYFTGTRRAAAVIFCN